MMLSHCTETPISNKGRSLRNALIAHGFVVLAWIPGLQPASAQVNCNVLPHGNGRANCYGAESQIYRQQSQQYNGIAQQQYQTYVGVGQALRNAPLIGRYAAPAWNAPGYYYNYRYGRP